jgi:hypothetical protein
MARSGLRPKRETDQQYGFLIPYHSFFFRWVTPGRWVTSSADQVPWWEPKRLVQGVYTQLWAMQKTILESIHSCESFSTVAVLLNKLSLRPDGEGGST